MKRIVCLFACFWGCLIHACADDVADPGEAAAPQLVSHPGPTGGPIARNSVKKVDVSSVIETVERSFRADGGAFIGGRRHYASRVEGPTITLTASGADGSPTTPFVFQTQSVTRGWHVISDEQTRTFQGDDGALAIHRGATVEHLSNGPEGVEQSWSFEERPRGEGDLVVQVDVSNYEYGGADDDGLRFRGSESDIHFVYSHGFWIDASGDRTPVKAIWNDGAIELRVPHNLVESSDYPAVLDPTIGPEIQHPIVPGSTDGRNPSVAFDGTNYVVAWRHDNITSRDDQIRAVRVSPAGVALDPFGIRVASSTGGTSTISVSANANHFLVVYEDTTNRHLAGQLFDAAGNRVGAQIELSPDRSFEFDSATDGTTFCVVWNDGHVVVRNDGTLAAPAASVTTRPDFSVTSNGSGYMLVYTAADAVSNSNIVAAPLSATGVLGTEQTVAANAATQISPDVIPNGSDYIVVFREGGGSQPIQNVQKVELDSSGAPKAPASLFLDQSEVRDLRLLRAGNDFVLAWSLHTSNQVFVADFAQIQSGATVTDVGFDTDRFDIAAGTNELMLVGKDPAEALILSPSGAASGMPFNPVRRPAWQFSASAVRTTNGFMTGWTNVTSEDDRDTWATLIHGNGLILTPMAIPISTAPNLRETEPLFATNDSEIVLAWMESPQFGDYTTFLNFYDANGAPIPGLQAVELAPNESARLRVVESNGTDFLVGYEASDTRFVRKVSSSGVVGTAHAIGFENLFEVTKAGTGYLAIGSVGVNQIDAQFLDSDGAPSGSPFTVRSQSSWMFSPQIASDGSNFLAAWSVQTSGSEYGIEGQFLDASGNPIGSAFMISSFSGLSDTIHGLDFNNGRFVGIYDRGSSTTTLGSAEIRGFDATVANGVQSTFVIEPNAHPPAHIAAGPGTTSLATFLKGTQAGTFEVSNRIVAYPSTPQAKDYLRADSTALQVDENASATVTLVGTDSDGNTATIEIVDPPQHGSLDLTPADGPQTGTFDGVDTTTIDVTYSPGAGTSTTDSFTYRVTSPAGDEADGTVEIDIIRPNEPPVFTTTIPPVGVVGETYTYEPAADDPEGLPVTFSVAPEDDCGGTVSGEVYSFEVGTGLASCRVAIVACDDYAVPACTTQSGRISLEAPNRPPEFVAPTPPDGARLDALVGNVFSFSVAASDPDSDPVDIRVEGLADGQIFDDETDVFRWHPTEGDLGEHVVTLVASDSVSAVTRDVTIVVSSDEPDAGETTPDAGTGTGAGDGGGSEDGDSNASAEGGCSTAGGGQSGLLWLAGLVLVVVRSRRRSR